MGVGGRGKAKRGREEEEEENELTGKSSVIVLISSDDEEANRDLTLEIVEMARKREPKRNRNTLEGSSSAAAAANGGGVVEAPSLIDLSSSEEVETISGRNGGQSASAEPPLATPVVGAASKKKKKTMKKKKMTPEKEEERKSVVEEEVKAVDSATKKEEAGSTTDSVVTQVNDMSDNIVLRKLLRGPRYFDPGSSQCDACFNCGEEGHMAADCTMGKRKKPCFVCGMFGHSSYKCTQDCFVCKRRGHVAKDCPDKLQRSSQDSKICLRCGDLGHDMSSCRNDYAPDDLKEIQCYVCRSFGHLCCVDIMETGSRVVSCYNCGQSGHSGAGCTNPRRETSTNVAKTPSLCYVCSEEGHFARECPKKFGQWMMGGTSTPAQRSLKSSSKNRMGSRSLPHDLGKASKRKSVDYEDRRNMTIGKPKIRGGWNVDDPGDFPVNDWSSPKTRVRNGSKFSNTAPASHKYFVY